MHMVYLQFLKLNVSNVTVELPGNVLDIFSTATRTFYFFNLNMIMCYKLGGCGGGDDDDDKRVVLPKF